MATCSGRIQHEVQTVQRVAHKAASYRFAATIARPHDLRVGVSRIKAILTNTQVFFNHWDQFLEIDRLWKDTQYTCFNCGKDDINRRVAGYKYRRQVRPCSANTSKQINAVHARHLIVENCQAVPATINKSQGTTAILGSVRLITQCNKQLGHQTARVEFIIHD